MPPLISVDLAHALLTLWRSDAPPPAEAITSSAGLLRDSLRLRAEPIGIRRKSTLRKDGSFAEVSSDRYQEDGYLLARLPRLGEGRPHPSRELWLLSTSRRLLYLQAVEERTERDAWGENPLRVWQADPHILAEPWEEQKTLWPEIRQLLAWLLLPTALELPQNLFATEMAAITFFQEVIRDMGLVHAFQMQGSSFKNILPKTLQYIRNPEAITRLARLRDHPEVVARRITVAVLIGLGPAHTLPHLIQALEDPDRSIRQDVLMTLQACISSETLEAIRKLLGDEFWWIRAQTARILGRVGGAEVIEPLKALWEDNDPEDNRHAVATAAQEAVSKILARLPRAADGTDYLQAGIDALRANDLSVAISHLREAVAIAPNDPCPYTYLGAACMQSDKLAEALRAFEKAASLSPDSPPYHYNLGMAYQRLGRIHEARLAFQTASRLGHPRAADLFRALAPQASHRAF